MNKLKLHIADDSKAVQKFYKANISDSDFEIRFAANGEDALRIYNSWNPDILLLDLQMSVMRVILIEICLALPGKKKAIKVLASVKGPLVNVRNHLMYALNK